MSQKSWLNWLRALVFGTGRPRPIKSHRNPSRYRARLTVEDLESRLAPAVLPPSAVTYDAVADKLQITGITSAANNIQVSTAGADTIQIQLIDGDQFSTPSTPGLNFRPARPASISARCLHWRRMFRRQPGRAGPHSGTRPCH
jgi:hypothetical protein